jgi:hypothetical protein
MARRFDEVDFAGRVEAIFDVIKAFFERLDRGNGFTLAEKGLDFLSSEVAVFRGNCVR